MRSKILCLFFLVFSTFIFAQRGEGLPEDMIIVDSIVGNQHNGIDADSLIKNGFETDNIVFPKKLSDDYRKKYKSKDFNYDEIRPQESLWSKIKRRFSQIWESLFGKPSKTINGLEYGLKLIAVLVVAGAVFLVAKYLMNKEGGFFWSKKNKKVHISSGVLHENIHEINFPGIISALEDRKDFRSAVRYQFLFVLKKMSDQKIIQWNPEKTNTDYISEISEDSDRKSYQELSYIFENVWYGEQKITALQYDRLKAKFSKTSFNSSRTS